MADLIKGIISLDGSSLLKTIDQLEKELKGFQDQLKKTTNLAEFNKLNQQISTTKNQIQALSNSGMKGLANSTGQANNALLGFTRVVQDSPYGLIGISNNIDQLIPSFQALKAQTGSTGGAFKALGASLTGAGGLGLALSLITTAATFATVGFGAWTRGLGESKKEVNDLALELSNLANEIEASKTQLDGFNKEISFLKNIGGITADINFGGTEAELLKLRQGVVLSDEAVANSEKNIQKLAEIRKRAQDLFYSNAPQSLKDAISPFTSYREIDMSVLDDFSDKNKKLVEGLKQADKEYYNAFALLEEERNKNVISKAQLRLGIANKEKEEEKKRLEEQKKLYEEYVKNVISKAERLNSAYKNSITLKLDFEPEDETQQKFQKALKYLKNYADRNFQFSFAYDPKGGLPALPIEAPPDDEVKRAATEFGQMFYTELQQYTGNKKVDLGLDKAVADEKARLLELRRFAEVVAGSLSNAFSSAFSAIANGANVFEALGQAIKGVIVDLIQAALKGLIFRAIMNAIAPGSGGAVSGLGSLLGGFGGFRAGGGPVGAGRSYVVGENGPELFTPGVSGNIIPNGRLGSVSNSFGGMQVQGVLTGRGNDLVAIISAAGRSNGRLI